MIARVIDFETTGFPEDDNAEIIELAYVEVDLDARCTTHVYSMLVKPGGSIPAVTKAVHHIIEADVADAEPIDSVLVEFEAGLSPDDVLVAHNAKFEQHFYPSRGHAWVDTYKVARVVYPDAPSHSNQALRYWLDLPVDRALASPPHRALPDCYVTAALLINLMDHKTIDEMVKISLYPALLKVMNFGKHRGTLFKDAPIDYLEWIRDKSDMDEDTKFTAKYWVSKRAKSEAGLSSS